MREILFLAHRLPFPPDRGDRIRSWNLVQALAEVAPVNVMALNDHAPDANHIAEVANIATSVTVVHHSRSKPRAIAAALLNRTPASVEFFRSEPLTIKIRALLAAHPIDCIYAFSGQMAAYVPHDFAGRFVMDFVDLDSAKFEQLGGFANRLESRRLLAWEIATARRANVSLFVTDAEAALFHDRSGLSATSLGNGIDLDHFDATQVTPVVKSGPLIVFTGQMDYPPNIEAVTDFARTAMPEILTAFPTAKFAIVGRTPTKSVQTLASQTVIVTGEVADTRPWLAAADVVVAPLKLARGIQNKVLEAMAMARPTVVSPAAAHGIDASDGQHFIVSNNPAAPVIDLLKNPARATAIGTAARARMFASYSWKAQLAGLADIVTG